MKIDYFGYELNIPSWAQYVATDKDGTVSAFEREPRIKRYEEEYWDLAYVSPFGGDSLKNRFLEIGKIDISEKPDNWWRKSLVDYSEPSESLRESSNVQKAVNKLVEENKNAWAHIIKVICYIGRIDDIDAQRDLLKHIRDIVGKLKYVQEDFNSESILRNRGKKYVFSLLTSETEKSYRRQSIVKLVREYSDVPDYEITEFIEETIRPNLNAVYVSFVNNFLFNKEIISVSGFRGILRETGVFEPHELNSIFRNYKDID